jgi:hypothetical protein
VPASHRDKIAPVSAERTNPGGRPVQPAIAAAEGLVESLVALDDDAMALEQIVEALSRMRTATSRLERNAHERIDRLRRRVIPEVRRCYGMVDGDRYGTFRGEPIRRLA